MDCLASCFVGVILLGSFFAIMFGAKNSQTETAFKASFNDTQRQAYQKIINQRMLISMTGMVIGITVALGYFLLFADRSKTALNTCVVVATTLGITYIYYMLRRKDMMLDHLTSMQQVRMWTDVYQQYQRRSAMGMIIGGIGFLLVVWGLTKFVKKF